MKVDSIEVEFVQNTFFIKGVNSEKTVSFCKFNNSESILSEVDDNVAEVSIWCDSFKVNPYKFFFYDSDTAIDAVNFIQKEMISKMQKSTQGHSIETV